MAEASASMEQGGNALTLPDDLVPEIVVNLDETGEYRAIFDPTTAQQLVDLRWAALRAGRLLGRRVKVSTTQAVSGSAPVVARVTFASGHPAAIPHQREPEQDGY